MTTKEKLLKLFESNKGNYFSGEEIAQFLGISRAAVWKAVNSLRSGGYAIDAVTNKGYCLAADTDIFSEPGIKQYLSPENQNLEISVVSSTQSTNDLMREKANIGCAEGCVIVANEQTRGKGRSGRNFYSPSGTGAYLSILLRPKDCSANQSLRMTTMAAVAMCEAIRAVSGKDAQIKWVNDIFIDGRKVCGILTEGAFSMETGLLEYAVLGAGINLYPPESGFPEDLREIAGTVFDRSGSDLKNRIVAEFLNRFFAFYRSGDSETYTEKYRQYSFVIGRKITVCSPEGERSAVATGIDDACRLEVQYDNGETGLLSYGEIRIRV